MSNTNKVPDPSQLNSNSVDDGRTLDKFVGATVPILMSIENAHNDRLTYLQHLKVGQLE